LVIAEGAQHNFALGGRITVDSVAELIAFRHQNGFTS
jgi:hypothetical protein